MKTSSSSILTIAHSFAHPTQDCPNSDDSLHRSKTRVPPHLHTQTQKHLVSLQTFLKPKTAQTCTLSVTSDQLTKSRTRAASACSTNRRDKIRNAPCSLSKVSIHQIFGRTSKQTPQNATKHFHVFPNLTATNG